MSTGMQFLVAVSLVAAAAASGPARRGMYVSLYREQPHQPHVFEYILGDAAKEDHLLAYCRRHGVNALTIYDGYPAMRQHAANLSAFVARARAVARKAGDEPADVLLGRAESVPAQPTKR